MAAIELNEIVEIGAPPEKVWRLLADPTAVVTCVPGAVIESVEPDGSVDGLLRTKLGPTVVEFRGRIVPEFDEERREGKLVARGSDKGGRTRGEVRASFRLTAVGDGNEASSLGITGAIRLEGVLSAFLQSGGIHLTRQMLREFGQSLSARCVAENSADNSPGSGPAQEVQPVSGLSLLGRVIRDVVTTFLRRTASSLARRSGRTSRGTEAGNEGL